MHYIICITRCLYQLIAHVFYGIGSVSGFLNVHIATYCVENCHLLCRKQLCGVI